MDNPAPIVKQEFIMSFALSPALGRNLMRPKVNPNVEIVASSIDADMVATASPTSSFPYSGILAATTQNKRPVTAPSMLFAMR